MREASALAGYIKCSEIDICLIVTNILKDVIRWHELYQSSNWHSSLQNRHRQQSREATVVQLSIVGHERWKTLVYMHLRGRGIANELHPASSEPLLLSPHRWEENNLVSPNSPSLPNCEGKRKLYYLLWTMLCSIVHSIACT